MSSVGPFLTKLKKLLRQKVAGGEGTHRGGGGGVRKGQREIEEKKRKGRLFLFLSCQKKKERERKSISLPTVLLFPPEKNRRKGEDDLAQFRRKFNAFSSYVARRVTRVSHPFEKQLSCMCCPENTLRDFSSWVETLKGLRLNDDFSFLPCSSLAGVRRTRSERGEKVKGRDSIL